MAHGFGVLVSGNTVRVLEAEPSATVADDVARTLVGAGVAVLCHGGRLRAFTSDGASIGVLVDG